MSTAAPLRPPPGPNKVKIATLRLLKHFDADATPLPKGMQARVDYYLHRLSEKNRDQILRRRDQVWPAIQRELAALGLPEELGAIAYVESHFDPAARGPGCMGLWQLTPGTARQFGLRVDELVDERIDVEKSSRAAAHYLAVLLSEFGEDSFMLAIASYNLGQTQMRTVLHDVSLKPGGFRKDKRNFWNLYQSKLLPQETAEYVPQVLAAAIYLAH